MMCNVPLFFVREIFAGFYLSNEETCLRFCLLSLFLFGCSTILVTVLITYECVNMHMDMHMHMHVRVLYEHKALCTASVAVSMQDLRRQWFKCSFCT